ncbi:MAG: hypothetical protein KC800_14925 [Candidatus Eremiobacteraeota bacterium]|nr:hypothetical protein [Candidatus Eremiobacteraeota bacterium]
MKDKIWFFSLLIIAATTALYQRAPLAEAASRHPFRLELSSGEVVNEEMLPVKVLQRPQGGQALLKINLDEHRLAKIRVHYQESPRQWSLNIGDSRSNNGYSGDGGHQTHDSEIQIVDSTMSVWGSDVMVEKEGRQLEQVRDFVRQGQVVEFEISDQKVKWKSPQTNGELVSHFLFALAGQDDMEGPVNRDIFVSLNRVVAGPHRSGSGASWVEVELIR